MEFNDCSACNAEVIHIYFHKNSCDALCINCYERVEKAMMKVMKKEIQKIKEERIKCQK